MFEDRICPGCNHMLPYDSFPFVINKHTGAAYRGKKCRMCHKGRKYQQTPKIDDENWDVLPDDPVERSAFLTIDALVIDESVVVNGRTVTRIENTVYVIDGNREIGSEKWTVANAIDAVVAYVVNREVRMSVGEHYHTCDVCNRAMETSMFGLSRTVGKLRYFHAICPSCRHAEVYAA